MAKRNEASKATFETSLDEVNLTMDEPARFFEGLQERYEISKIQNIKLRKKNEFLKNKWILLSRRKIIYQFVLKRPKKILRITNIFARVKALMLFLIKKNFWIFKIKLIFWTLL